ncbi:MAG TPA: oxidoreductase, partial [Acetobacteraceae bacterium]|nr:oxidoreductase [Acetobacteraceae bacterium]
MRLTRRSLASILAMVALSRLAAAAETALSMPAGKVILTISGQISVCNVGATAQFDRDMLEALGWSSF